MERGIGILGIWVGTGLALAFGQFPYWVALVGFTLAFVTTSVVAMSWSPKS
ncbi:MAG: hypothetical protein JSV79_06625 [Armatimonadota bacterium]|nr:MAG: hypothetical protein JSV79_06625 [Armatimonadota bacterium]